MYTVYADMLTDDKLKENPTYSVPSKVLLPEHKLAEQLQCTLASVYQVFGTVLEEGTPFPLKDIPSVNALMVVMQSTV